MSSSNTTSYQRSSPAAVILAAGLSSRCGRFKPLLPLGQELILERVIRTYRNAGISDIVVVTGYRSEDMMPLIGRLQVGFVLNPRYDQGMFSSVVAGVSGLPAASPVFFIHPVDIPLVRPQTLARLREAFTSGNSAVYYPVFRNERGHPPLISSRFRKDIVRWSGAGGLRGFLEKHEADACDIPVIDRFILQDIDNPEEYRQAVESLPRYDIPSDDECHMLMKDVSETIRRHCDTVAVEAERIGMRLNAAGCRLDISLIAAAARLHDIARKCPDHAAAGALILRRHGFERAADIVETHMDFFTSNEAPITEAEVVYLADKRVQADCIVSIEARFENKLRQFAERPDICRNILQRRDHAIKSLQRIEARIGDI